MKAVGNLDDLSSRYFYLKHREPVAFVPRLSMATPSRAGLPFTTFICAKFSGLHIIDIRLIALTVYCPSSFHFQFTI